MPPEYLSDKEIADLASKMRVSDPGKDNGAFDSLSQEEAFIWLRLLGIMAMPAYPQTDKFVRNWLRFGLWDSQRLDYLFHGQNFTWTERSEPKLDVSSLKSWPTWEKGRPELGKRQLGLMKMDGIKDAKKLDGYVLRHFTMSAFTQQENMTGVPQKCPPNLTGAWVGSRVLMSRAATDITHCGKDSPFLTFFTTDPGNGIGGNVLLMELLDVKECPWPDPTQKQWSQFRTCQETKFGWDANGPIVPMMQTPKFPLVLVRYSYMEGRPKGDSQFTLHLESLLKEKMPGASAKKVREKLQWHMGTGEEVPEAHLRMMARLLSANSDWLDQDFVKECQSHWKGVNEDVRKETRISFFVPCLRLRWRAKEELETGYPIKTLGQKCPACGKDAERLMCTACKSVYYCSPTCNKADWTNHKSSCKVSQRLLRDPDSFPSNKYYVSTRTYVDFIPESGFAIEQEAIRQSGTSPLNDCPPNEYGNERFMIRATMPRSYSHMNGAYRGETVFLWDRRRSLLTRSSPGDPPMARERNWPVPIPFHEKGHQRFKEVIGRKGVAGQLIYLWAKRVGDCLELDLEDVPNQNPLEWE